MAIGPGLQNAGAGNRDDAKARNYIFKFWVRIPEGLMRYIVPSCHLAKLRLTVDASILAGGRK